MVLDQRAAELVAPLDLLPPVDFCCVYGSSLLPNNNDKTSMVDYILGVADPIQWHSENLERNRHHYSKWMARLGPKAINCVADGIGVGVHFNPFVVWRDKMIKYGVVRMHDLAMDILTWDRFYLSGRLHKPVQVLIDNWDIQKVNLINLKAATSASLLLLPAKFSEEDLYAKICSLSYMGDLRMLFAEDKNKVKNIVRGSFTLFQSMYKPLVQEYAAEGLLKIPSDSHIDQYEQDCGLSATSYHFFSLPSTIQDCLDMKLKTDTSEMLASVEIVKPHTTIASREVAARCLTKALRHVVMASSARQAISGLVATGGVNATRYFARKLCKAWKSRTS
ncbi:phosphatidate cytidylyltransferase, mitochondrial [Canna indica]|uniref:Phosphatidate cytidylyltransferase, mitochondrial n=1 Tax=Canna indica TaxID=4628 RepID=A0AAQ3Q1K6_9LILI|nr:phosphatidate cytidylyltransferase, mitochondrial [Canna indica]